MKTKNKPIVRCIISAILVTVVLCMCGCGGEKSTVLSLREQGLGEVSARQLENATEIDLRDSNLTDISVLENCGKLQRLDLRGNSITTEQYDNLREALPDCEILWSVPVMGRRYDNNAQKLVLDGEYDDTINNIKYLAQLKYCDLSDVNDVDNDELFALHENYPEVKIVWWVDLGSERVYSDTTEYYTFDVENTNLSALKYCYCLESITIMDVDSEVDIAPLADISTLRSLTIEYSDVVDFSVLKNFTGITTLDLRGTAFNDLSAISHLTCLEHLYFGRYSDILNMSEDLSEISGLTSLKSLTVYNTNIKDISVLANMTEMEELVLKDNPIEDFSPIAGLTSLKTLDITNTLVSDISFLNNLTNITSLSLGDDNPWSYADRRIKDFSPVGNLVNIEELYITYTSLSDLSFISSLKKADYISLTDNKITDPSPLAALTRLREVNLYGNPIATDRIEALREKMPNTYVYFDDYDEGFCDAH